MFHISAFKTLGTIRNTHVRGQLQHINRVAGLLTEPKSLCSTQQRRHVGGSFYKAQMGQHDMVAEIESTGKKEESKESRFYETLYKMFEAAATTAASLAMLGLAGFSYHKYYKSLVLSKMEDAFKAGGADPTLDMITSKEDKRSELEHWVPREEQSKIDAIVNGTDKGKYYLLIGETGTGKASMLFDAATKVDGEGVSILEAHSDLEIVRLRLGKCLNFEFSEDFAGSLFSMKGPRETTALLDIERALNKLEKVAIKRRKKFGRPLVLIINKIHLLRDDDDGRDLLELMQQKAEQWASSNLVTVIFNSDAYWVFERFKQYATRMEILPIADLSKEKSLQALHNHRSRFYQETPSPAVLEEVYKQVGGRLAFLSRVARSEDMLEMCDHIRKVEKTWFLNQCWILGDTMDDECEEQQTFASIAMIFAQALVEKENEMMKTLSTNGDRILPEIPLHEARQIMTRSDFIQQYDQRNLFTIDSEAMVRADSVPMQNAIREICSQPGFDLHLKKTLMRLDELEGLARTREIVLKDLVQGGKYKAEVKEGSKGGKLMSISWTE